MRPRSSLLRLAPKCEGGSCALAPRAGGGRPAQEYVSGAAASVSTSGDVLDAASVRLGTPQVNVGAGYVGALKSQNQQTENRCVATAVCTAIYLRALLMAPKPTLEALRPEGNMPSVAHAYHAQRRRECMTTHRCDCGDVCGGLCNAKCGSLLSVVVGVCKEGICLERHWPVSASRDVSKVRAANTDDFLERKPHFRLTRAEFVDLSLKREALVYNVERMVREGVPVVTNLFLYPNQDAWCKTQRMRPADRAATVYSSVHAFPAGKGARLALGHCVIIVGFDPVARMFRVRNSFGDDWGWHGDFALPYALLNKDQVHGLMGVEEVVLDNIARL